MMDLEWESHEEFTEPHLAPPKSHKKQHIMEYVRNARREIASLPKTKFGKAVKKKLVSEVRTVLANYKRSAIKAKGRSR